MTADFEPTCMTAEELAGWHAANANIYSNRERAARPCHDCPLAFAQEMRGLGCCNGEPHRRGGYAIDPRPVVHRRSSRYADAETRLRARREQWRLSSQRRRARAAAA